MRNEIRTMSPSEDSAMEQEKNAFAAFSILDLHERKPSGARTFRMIQKVPEMTSFGLDLFEEIVEKRSNGKTA